MIIVGFATRTDLERNNEWIEELVIFMITNNDWMHLFFIEQVINGYKDKNYIDIC